MAATNASRTDSRDSTITDGSAGSSFGESGSGSSQVISRCSAISPVGSEADWPRPEGNGRRCLPSSAVRLVFVAMRYSQVRTDDLPWKPLYDFQARK